MVVGLSDQWHTQGLHNHLIAVRFVGVAVYTNNQVLSLKTSLYNIIVVLGVLADG